MSSQLYACPNYEGVHRLIHGNTMTPTFTRGPGESVGSFVLETAMDELAHEIGLDPIELRLRDALSGGRQRQRLVERRPGGVPAARRGALRLAATATRRRAPRATATG